MNDYLLESLKGLKYFNDHPAAERLAACIRGEIQTQIEKQPLQLLTVTSDGKVEGPLAPAILKIVNDAIADYAAQVRAVNRQLTDDEKVNSSKVVERVKANLVADQQAICAPTPYDEYARKPKPILASSIGAFDRIVEAQREDAITEYEQEVKESPPEPTHAPLGKLTCQHDLTKPVATRHVIRHTDDGIITKCHACGEFRSYTIQEVD